MMKSSLSLIRNNRLLLKLVPKRWPSNLPPPILVADTRAKEIAVSALRGFAMRDSVPVYACDLSAREAQDVARWHEANKT
jgi:hypothetical protein